MTINQNQTFHSRTQPGRLKPPLLSQVKVENKEKNLYFLADFVHTTSDVVLKTGLGLKTGLKTKF